MKYDSDKELHDVVDKLGKLFDVARLVDPITTTVDGEHGGHACGECFDVWNKTGRCANCTSSRVLVTGETAHKYETIGDDIYLITSERVETPTGACVLELVSRMEKRFEEYYRSQQTDLTHLEEMRILALHDPMTGIFNRHYAEENVPKLVERAREAGDDTLVALIDIDKLKTANDVFGHLAGDALIRTVVSQALKVFPAQGEDHGFMARIGGDEFLIALRLKDKSQADELMEKIIASVKQGHIDEFPEVVVSASMGGVLDSEFEGDRFEDFLQQADIRLYDAKKMGRGRFVSEGKGHFEPPTQAEGEQRRFRRDEPYEKQ